MTVKVVEGRVGASPDRGMASEQAQSTENSGRVPNQNQIRHASAVATQVSSDAVVTSLRKSSGTPSHQNYKSAKASAEDIVERMKNGEREEALDAHSDLTPAAVGRHEVK